MDKIIQKIVYLVLALQEKFIRKQHEKAMQVLQIQLQKL